MPLFTPPPFGRTFEGITKTTTTITAHATIHTKGTWTQLIASTAEDAYGIWTYADGMGVTATNTSGLLDIGYGLAGGADPGSDVNIVANWNVGWTGTSGASKPFFPAMQFWPVFIPAGSKIWARLQAAITVDTCRVIAVLQREPPMGSYVAPRAIAYGVLASSRGTIVTSGAAVYGTAVLLGTTTKDHRLWSVGIDGATDTSVANLGFFLVRLHIGSGTTGIIGEWIFNVDTTTEMMGGPFPPVPLYKPVPSGTDIYASINATATSDLLGVIAYGM